jgi:YQGE family putative transporter
MLRIFVNTFLWRQGGGVLQIALYNLHWIIGLPIGFYFNGLLLRKVHVKYLYFFGTVLQGIGSALAIFSGVLTPLSVSFYGLLYGIAAGFFWSNRNSLDYRLSQGKNRGFYNHLYYVVDMLLSVVTPVIIGWLIVSGENLGFYQADTAYRVLLGIALALLAVSGYLIASFPMPVIAGKQLRVKNPSRHWRQVRLFNFLFNLMWGVNFFLPAVLILHFGSKEGIFGTLQSLAALLAAGTMYILGRKTQMRFAVRTVALANLLYFAGAVFLLWQFSWVGAAVYLASVVVSSPIRWGSSYTVIMAIMDGEDGAIDGETDYALVLDNELFFNIGRSVSILFFLAVMYFSLEAALRWVPLVISLTQFAVLLPLRLLVKQALRTKTSQSYHV